MFWIILYCIIGTLIAIGVAKITADEPLSKTSDTFDNICINLIVILTWPVLVYLIIKSCITSGNNALEDKHNKNKEEEN